MRIPITKYGLPQVAVFPAIILALMVVVLLWLKGRAPLGVTIAAEVILFVLLIWVLAFFRDPARQIPSDANILLAPADGIIADIETIEDHPIIGEKVLRIGIFLNIFNVHINRAPCAVRIEDTTYKKGKFVNAMSSECGRVNESNDIVMARLEAPDDKLLVRQISGAIARRIVCEAQPGRELAAGEKFGMIKFGSRTELYLPIREQSKCLVAVGDKVKAGLTILVRYE